MLRPPKKVLFALDAVIDIAYNADIEPVQSKSITERQGIPQRYLEQVLQQMVRAGILKGVRGPRGGYHLARERRRITVGDIVRVAAQIDGEDGAFGSQSAMGQTIVEPLWSGIEAELMNKLDSISLADLCQKATEAGIPRERPRKADFTI